MSENDQVQAQGIDEGGNVVEFTVKRAEVQHVLDGVHPWYAVGRYDTDETARIVADEASSEQAKARRVMVSDEFLAKARHMLANYQEAGNALAPSGVRVRLNIADDLTSQAVPVFLDEIERLRADNAALREIAQAVAFPTWVADNQQGFHLAFPIAEARALLATLAEGERC